MSIEWAAARATPSAVVSSTFVRTKIVHMSKHQRYSNEYRNFNLDIFIDFSTYKLVNH